MVLRFKEAVPMEIRLLCIDEPYMDEKLTGYLIRMTELNNYEKLVWIFSMAGFNDLMSLLQNTSSNLNNVSKERISFETLSILTDISQEKLWDLTYSNYLSIESNDPYLCNINQNKIHKEAMVVKNCKVCIKCIEEYGYIKKIWSLAYYTVCTEHKIKLVDKCANCGLIISWNRNSLSKCKCGYTFSKQEISEVSTSELIIADLLYHKCGYSSETNYKTLFNVFDLFSLNKFLNLLFFLYNCEILNKGYHIAHILTNDEIHNFIIKVNIVNHPSYNEILETLEEVHLFSTDSVESDSLFLYGTPGVGKSTVLEKYRDKYPEQLINRCTIVPVLYNKVPVGATPKSLASSLLSSLGDPAYDKGTETNQTERLIKLIHKCKVEMIMIDEFQHLIDRETKHVLNKASDWLKKFFDDVGVPIVLCGMPESIKIFEHNEQLDRRFLKKVRMEKFNYSTSEEQIYFRTFLNEIDEQLPFFYKSNLAKKSLANKFYYATNGIPSYINMLLREATTIAAKNGNDSIDENHLYSAFRKIKFSNRPNVFNPFADDEFNIIEAFELEERAKSISRTS
jgi:type II secretory pathway predicted ATPase ExeA